MPCTRNLILQIQIRLNQGWTLSCLGLRPPSLVSPVYLILESVVNVPLSLFARLPICPILMRILASTATRNSRCKVTRVSQILVCKLTLPVLSFFEPRIHLAVFHRLVVPNLHLGIHSGRMISHILIISLSNIKLCKYL